jgi:cardiolipin synthase
VKLAQIPNAICVLRILLIVPLVFALFRGDYRLALLLIVIAGASDGVDGFLAKTFGWQSRLGSLLDPAADKLLLVSSIVSLTILGLVPFGVTAIVVARDIVIVCGAFAYLRLAGTLTGEPLLISKLNTLSQLMFIVLTIMQAAWQRPGSDWLTALGALVVFTSITSGLSYVLIWSDRARQAVQSGSR